MRNYVLFFTAETELADQVVNHTTLRALQLSPAVVNSVVNDLSARLGYRAVAITGVWSEEALNPDEEVYHAESWAWHGGPPPTVAV